jgi:hypothetical protein
MPKNHGKAMYLVLYQVYWQVMPIHMQHLT